MAKTSLFCAFEISPRKTFGTEPDKLCDCRLVSRLRHARLNEAHVPSIGVASIDHDAAAAFFAKIAIRSRYTDGELGKAIPAFALDMRFVRRIDR